MRLVMYAAITLALGACSGSKEQNETPKEAKDVAGALSGDAKGPATDNPMCKLFSNGEIEGYIGEPVKDGGNAVGGMGCQWAAQDGSGDVIVSALSSNFAVSPSGSEGFRALPDIGKEGFVAKELDGFTAGAIVGKDFVKVSVAGLKADPDKAVALLKETIARRHQG